MAVAATLSSVSFAEGSPTLWPRNSIAQDPLSSAIPPAALRFYYKGAQQAALLQWEEDQASLLEAKWWQIESISADRLTT
jgi:hypothetical protein